MELKEAVALFEELTEEREDVMLYVLEYLEALQVVTAKSWRELEKQLILEGTLKETQCLIRF